MRNRANGTRVNGDPTVSSKAGFYVLATKLGTKDKVQEDQLLECLTLYDRLPLLAETRAKRKHVFRVRCLSDGSLRVS